MVTARLRAFLVEPIGILSMLALGSPYFCVCSFSELEYDYNVEKQQ